MRISAKTSILAASLLLGGADVAAAQQQPTAPPQQPTAAPQEGANSVAPGPVSTPAPGSSSEGAQPAGKLVLLFATGSAALDAQNEAILDKASRLYRDGKPIIMIVSGSTDTTGSPERNLTLSQQRATAVAHGLLARGIPAQRTQILAKGETNLPVPTPQGVAEAQNRRVEITWR
ncbi:MAG: OmpA family protein [Acetobacteraceae bacterium]|nr:OmpA family protein [Acetobacteraceae bacterium]